MTSARALAVVVVLGALGVAARAGEPLTVSTGRLGNIYSPTDPIQVTLQGGEGDVAWRIENRAGDAVARGHVTAANATVPLDLPNPGPGYFELVTAPAGDKADGGGRTAFAVIPEPSGRAEEYGVMTHIGHGWAPDFAPLLPRIGVRHVRDEQYWSALEKKPGEFKFPVDYVAYMEQLARLDLDPLLALTFGNPLYDEGTTPTSRLARAAYGRFGAVLANRYPEQVRAFEVWNEINGSWCDGDCPADPVGAYIGLLEAAAAELKDRSPAVTLVGGATAGIPLPWWRELAERGGLEHFDVASVHSYPDEPEEVVDEISGLRAIMRDHGGEKPIWVTETGKWGGSEEERREASGWLIKQLTLLRALRVERVYWYLAHDYDDVDGMGLLRAPDSPFGAYAPNPSYVAMATLVRELAGARFIRREGTDPRTRVYLFAQNGREVRVVWSTEGTANLVFSGVDDFVQVDAEGKSAPVAATGAQRRIRLSEEPVFLVGRARLDGEQRPDRLLDDNVPGSTDTSLAAWHYGYAVRSPGEAATSGPDFKPATPLEDAWSSYWGDPRWGFLKLDRRNAEPTVSGPHQIWAIRRWTAPRALTVTITGSAELPPSAGDGVEVIVVNDGEILEAKPVRAGEATTFATTAALRAGSTVDIIVTPGPALDGNFDSVTLKASITAPLAGEVGSK